ncbi:carbonic anhydrase [Oceanobacillus polygoni]|uniref:carbonic anhydrase n=1 Tax=Oceanobacillus polygoni TaxID=1235259 RepID=A0A9X0YQA8_9BACI|nr:carbonic anhydrase family protein [Oceanobacillus polygoni]MBP2076744.1 carbonic anhydrase [Oceanobacillus polygoni]
MKKKLVYLFSAVSVSFLLGACSEQTPETAALKEEKTDGVKEEQTTDLKGNEAEGAYAQWSYNGDTGPEHWGKLDNANLACVNGSEQSPINIEFTQVEENKKLEEIQIHYEPTTFSLANNGHTVQANTVTESNRMVIEGNEYKLAQFHFHTPSEHQFNGQNYDMELHIVHEDANGKLAVLGLMIKEGKENEILAPVWEVLPKEETEKDIRVKEPIDLKALLPKNQTSFHYNGSLTTPPCTEEVKWVINEQPIEMSKVQIQAFKEIFPENHRPVQTLNKREIIKN